MNTNTMAARWRCLTATRTRRGALAGAITLLITGTLTSSATDAEGNYHKHRQHHQHRNRKRHERHKRHRQPIDQAPGSPPTSPPPPAPETRPDAMCIASIDFGTGDPSGTFRFAQTFTALASGALVSAELQIIKREGTTGDYVLGVSPVDGSGRPSDEVLTEISVPDGNVPEGSHRILFTFTQPISVTAGATYALVLNRPGGNMEWAAHGGGADCAGESFTSQGQTAPFQLGSFDFIYTTFVSS